jgi:hypothetical protein
MVILHFFFKKKNTFIIDLSMKAHAANWGYGAPAPANSLEAHGSVCVAGQRIYVHKWVS